MNKTVYDPVFKTQVTCFVEKDPQKAKKKVEKIIEKSIGDMSFMSEAKTIEYYDGYGDQRIIIWLRDNKTPVLAHEIIHVIDFSFSLRGIEFSSENSEVIAYLMEFFLKNLSNQSERV